MYKRKQALLHPVKRDKQRKKNGQKRRERSQRKSARRGRKTNQRKKERNTELKVIETSDIQFHFKFIVYYLSKQK